MPPIVSITDFRKNIFDYSDQIVASGDELEIERNGKVVLKVVPVNDDPSERARRLLELAPKLAGIWKDIPQKEFDEINEFMRGKKEKRYMARLKARKW